MDYRINFFKTQESGTDVSPYCHSFIEKGTLSAALRHAKERLQGEHFLKAEIWEQGPAGGHGILRHTIKEDEAKYIEMLIPPTMEEARAGLSKPRQYGTMYPATDGEILEALKRNGGFTSEAYERMAHNVVIADGAIVVAVKPEPKDVLTLYVIDGRELPLKDYRYEDLRTKAWASPPVLADIRKAEETLLAKLHGNNK